MAIQKNVYFVVRKVLFRQYTDTVLAGRAVDARHHDPPFGTHVDVLDIQSAARIPRILVARRLLTRFIKHNTSRPLQ